MFLTNLNAWDDAIRTWAASLGYVPESVLRLVLAALFGGLVGLEREVRGRQAGFRTYLLVCVGSAMVMLVSVQLALNGWHADGKYNIQVDPGRIAYGVMTGIGFLGAGVIVQQKGGAIRGLTTAAGLWCIAAVGLGIGLGMYLLSALGIVIILVALWFLDYVEEIIPKYRYRNVKVRTKYHAGCVADTVAKFKKGGLHVIDAEFERSEDLVYAIIELQVAFVNSAQYYGLERDLEADPDYHLMTTREV
jgi:putative Mg2+ transporter-C (MgtC) family protein